MKKIILILTLVFCSLFPSLAQKTPIELVNKARILVKDSADLVENRKELIKETKALIRDVQGLNKKKKGLRFSNQNANFQIGLTYQIFTFNNYQSVVGEGRTKLIEPDNFNGFAVGLTFRKKINTHFSLKSELTYATQNENFVYSTFSFQDFDGNKTYLYNAKININYGQLKLPILLDYKLKLGLKSTWSLHSYLGGQITFLANYKTIQKTYEVYPNFENFDINNANLEREWINDSGAIYQTIWEYSTGQAVIESTFNPSYEYYPFRRFLFGIVGGMEIEKMLSPTLALGFGFRYEYNLSKTEAKGYFATTELDNSNQKRIGMTLSLLKTIH